MIQHLRDRNIYKKLDSCVDNKIQSNLLRFFGQFKRCFTEPEWRFQNDKHHKVRNFYVLLKTYRYKIIESAICYKHLKQ